MSPAKRSKHQKKSKRAKTKQTKASAITVVRELAEIVEAHSLSELHFDGDAFSVTLRRGGELMAPAPVIHSAPLGAPVSVAVPQLTHGDAAAPTSSDDNGAFHAVTSPFVGTFYRSPNPDSDPYVSVGQRVEKGQILCIVEAMKLMNEIEADQAGIISHILVENSEPVEYGQELFKISPA